MKKLLVLSVIALATLFSCNQPGTGEVKDLGVSDFLAQASDYVGQTVAIEGTVSHVCKHSGKRLFLYDENKEEVARVESSDAVPQFDAALVDGRVRIEGVVKEFRIDETYLAEWEQELMSEEEESGEHLCEGDKKEDGKCTEGEEVEKEECQKDSALVKEECKEKKEECKEKKEVCKEKKEVCKEKKEECKEKKEVCEEEEVVVKTDSNDADEPGDVDEDDDSEINEQLEQIENFRKQIAESENGYIVLYYYIECSKVEEITEPEAE